MFFFGLPWNLKQGYFLPRLANLEDVLARNSANPPTLQLSREVMDEVTQAWKIFWWGKTGKMSAAARFIIFPDQPSSRRQIFGRIKTFDSLWSIQAHIFEQITTLWRKFWIKTRKDPAFLLTGADPLPDLILGFIHVQFKRFTHDLSKVLTPRI